MSSWVLFLGFATIGQVLFVASQIAVGRRLGAQAERAGIGLGPKLFTLRVAGVPVDMRLLPLAAWVKFADMIEDGSPPTGFRALPPLRRAAVVAAPWVILAVFGAALLGPARLADALAFLAGAPRTDAAVRAYFALPAHAELGVVLALLAALNLLPFPKLAGGRALRYLFAWWAPPPDPERAKKR